MYDDNVIARSDTILCQYIGKKYYFHSFISSSLRTWSSLNKNRLTLLCGLSCSCPSIMHSIILCVSICTLLYNVLVFHGSSYVLLFFSDVCIHYTPNSIIDKERQFKLIKWHTVHTIYIYLCKIIHLSREYSRCYNYNQTMPVCPCRSGHILHYSQHTHSLYSNNIIIIIILLEVIIIMDIQSV